MRPALLIAFAMLTVAATPAGAAKCQKHKGETIVARSAKSIVTRSGTDSTDWVYRGCLFARGRRYRLLAQDPGYPYQINRLEKVKLAGPYVALAVDYSQKGDTSVGLTVFDLRKGRAGSTTAGSDYQATMADSYTLERLVLSKHGAVAWRGTHRMGYPGTEETIQKVTVADSHGTRLLDSGEPGSLAGPVFAEPKTVTWSHDGSHSARAFYGLPRY